MAQPLSGVVKAVPSGDTVIVMGVDASRGPPPEKQITLSGLEAPRLGNRNGPTADAPWAWASREHLRQRAVGKRVTFKIEGAAPSGTREFGTVWLEDGTSLRDVQLTAGWAKLKDKRGGADDAEAAGLARAAEDQGLGVWAAASASAVRDVKWAGTFEVADVVKAKKGQPLDAVVEQVPGGTLVRVMLTPGFEQVSVMLSGVQSPTVRFVDGVEEAQPFAREVRAAAAARPPAVAPPRRVPARLRAAASPAPTFLSRLRRASSSSLVCSTAQSRWCCRASTNRAPRSAPCSTRRGTSASSW